MPACKKCGNTTRDQRGRICDSCAFPNKKKGAKLADAKPLKKLDPLKAKKVMAARKGVAENLKTMLLKRGK